MFGELVSTVAGAAKGLLGGGGGGGGDTTLYQPSQNIGALTTTEAPLFSGMQIGPSPFTLTKDKLIFAGAAAFLIFVVWKKYG